MLDDFYGLRGRPFQQTPDAAFFFESQTHRKALSYLSYGLAQGEGIVVITGKLGSGKSTLLAQLLASVDRTRLTAAQVDPAKLGSKELVHVVAQSFGLRVEGHDKASALGAIEGFLHDEARAGRRCLLIVDDAQNLTFEALEELRLLSNFQLGSHPLLQTLLLGQPELCETILEHPGLEQLRQRVIAIHQLEALEPSEVQPYIEHRLKCVGWQGNPSFDQRVFAEIYSATGGVPRRINQIANRLLLLGAVEQRNRIDGAMLAQVLSELAGDGNFALFRTGQKPLPSGGQAQPPTHASQPEPSMAAQAAGVSMADFEAALAQRDARIAELQQALSGLSASRPAASSSVHRSQEVAALSERIEALESRLYEQERIVRHTLTMLIEWIESDGAPRAAA